MRAPQLPVSPGRPEAHAHRVLLTGASGFVGGHLARRLVALGCDVHAVVRSLTEPWRIPPGVRAHVHDGTTDGLLRIVVEARPELTFHLAARFVGRHTPADVLPLVRDNIGYACQLFEALAQFGTTGVVNVGTAWQYGADASAFRPVALYAATKQAAADLLAYYVETERLRAVTVILHDTYGPGDTRPKLVPLLLRAAQDREPLAMSAGEQEIDIVHVDDVVDALLLAGRRLTDGAASGHEEWTVSSGERYTLRQLVESFLSLHAEIRGTPPRVEFGAIAYREREIMRPWSGGAPVPGWVSRVSLQAGFRSLLSDP